MRSIWTNGKVVRAKGLEPPRLSPRGPKPRASTNSATPARPNLKVVNICALTIYLVAGPAKRKRRPMPYNI